MKIVAVDPGGTTGIAEWNVQEEKLYQFQIGPQEHHLELWEYLSATAPDLIICERFNYQRRELDKGVALVLVSREYIGVCKLYAHAVHHKLVMQQPSCMALFHDARLKALGFYRPAMVHANDATRHLFYYITTEMKDDTWIRRAREPE
jgi:hypothetical protein